jgi:hypothetical protein
MVYVEGAYIDSCFSIIGMDEVLTEYDINIFPNPSTETIKINIKHHTGKLYFQIFDVQGKAASLKETLDDSRTISIENLNPGIYFLRAEAKHGIINKKIIVY